MVQRAGRMQTEGPEKCHAKYLDPRTTGGAMDCHLGIHQPKLPTRTGCAWGCAVLDQRPEEITLDTKSNGS